MVSTGDTACVYQELPKDACFTKPLVGCDSSYRPGDWQELQYRNRAEEAYKHVLCERCFGICRHSYGILG